MLTKSQVALLKSIDGNSNAVLSHEVVSGKVAIVSGDYRKSVRFGTFLKLLPHLQCVRFVPHTEYYKAK